MKMHTVFNRLLFFSVVFVATFFLSTSIATARDVPCVNPTIYNENGGVLNPLGVGWLTINGTEHAEMQIEFPVMIKNKNPQGMSITLRPYDDLRDYIDDAYIYLPADTNDTVNLTTWVGGQSYIGIINVEYTCDDGLYNIPFQYVKTYIIGQKIEPPPNSTCESEDLDGCYQGKKRDYYCSHGELQYSESCTETCCEIWGGQGSFCSDDKQVCYTMDTLPPGTEGNIAFVCKDENCKDGNERYMQFMFRTHGWNVTSRQQEDWTDWELDNYDIIACVDQKDACDFDFNSIIYNQHTNERKSFLEIPDSRSARAADTFEYLESKRASTERELPYINNVDYITDGYNGTVATTTGAERYLAVKDKYQTDEVKDLADSGPDEESSVMFKVKEDVDHGRYAFIGWLYDSTALTTDGSILLNRTLKWLKEGDAGFGGTNVERDLKGNVAFICNKDNCNKKNEMALMKYLRSQEYKVTGKEEESWAFAEINTYDVIACGESRTCDIEIGSAPYLAHRFDQEPFLEIPYRRGLDAAEVFNYVNTRSYRESGYGIVAQGTSTIFDGYNGYMEIFKDEESVYGPEKSDLLASLSIVDMPDTETSASFVSYENFERGRYAYVGWAPDIENLNENGEKLLARTVDWLICGDGCLENFYTEFDDIALNFEVLSPTEGLYDSRRVYATVNSSQVMDQMMYSINGGRERRMCRECSYEDKRIRAVEGNNELKIILLDFMGETHNETVNFFVDSKEPRIYSVYPRYGDLSALQNFTIKYTEDNLENITFVYAGPGVEESLLMDWCSPGSYQYCTIEVDLSAHVGEEIVFYFVVSDKTHEVNSRIYYSEVLA